MAYLNRATLIGNVGKDPVTTMTNTGKKCVRFSLATGKRYRDQNGEQKEQTEWHNIAVWGKAADTFESLGIRKGTSLYVEGEITNRSWTDNQGQKRYMSEINCNSFQILTPRNANGTSQQSAPAYDYSQPYNQAPAQPTQQDAQGYTAGVDDDLPF